MNKKYYRYIIVFLYIAFIFYNSLQTGTTSGGLSAQLTEIVSKFIKMDFDRLHHFIRKLAHFMEYFALAILVLWAMKATPLFSNRIVTIIIFMFLVPIIDETIQLFVPGRVGAIQDCIIDMCGYLTCILLNGMRKKVFYERT